METETKTNFMPVTTTSILSVVFKNMLWLLALAFYPLIDWVIIILPDWIEFLDGFKLIGGAIIILLVIFKLVLEIIKLIRNKR